MALPISGSSPARSPIRSLSIWARPLTASTTAPALAWKLLPPAQDADDQLNSAPDSVAGFNVNTIAIEVPITLLTSDGAIALRHGSERNHRRLGDNLQAARSPFANPRCPAQNFGDLAQIQRFGNPLINELIIGTGSKDFWSMSEPVNDSQFAAFDLDPLIARVFNAVYGFNIPTPPRTDLLPLVTYAPPIAPKGTPAGPIADLMRLNTGVPPTPMAQRKRLGLIAGDAAGFPNGRRLTDDVVDIVERVGIGGILSGPGVRCRAEQPARRWRQRSRRSPARDVPVCALCIQRTRQPSYQPGRSYGLRRSANILQPSELGCSAGKPGWRCTVPR